MQLIHSFFSIIRTFEIKDLVDILCITFVIYGILKLVRETRAEQLLKGVVILVAVYLLAFTFQLTMLTALLRNFFEFGVIILFIIFQPEIRKALEQIGRSKLSKNFKFGMQAKEDHHEVALQKKAISAVVDAALVFQRAKTGALIVFERRTKLGEIIDTGTIVDAEPSVSVIGNLFFNKAPLHDGAVVMRDGRVYAAGCILPLTKNEEVDVNLGTRHRAALGMSEESDAVIVVVSEETGNISVAYRGRLTRDYTRDTLKERLEELLLPGDKTDIIELIPIFSSRRKEKRHEKD
ncbi:MAG TPA: TIGR00159 family protein [Candidatus Scatavimonas merdigallinarum]|uniref:Diadenylate cyclase n=1 Tax=Candidatus Scatavimonas merdigallinarum TaxID=2840914 RepID=A0A9D1CV98_9FIRM|nr:TIGR00159 family protein [Candidatus Scatavimonas merdigallinarum]